MGVEGEVVECNVVKYKIVVSRVLAGVDLPVAFPLEGLARPILRALPLLHHLKLDDPFKSQKIKSLLSLY